MIYFKSSMTSLTCLGASLWHFLIPMLKIKQSIKHLCDVCQQVGVMALNNMSVAALGRPFTLGMLYDARKDQLIPGEST